MKTATQKSFVLISLIVLLVFGVSTNSFATSADEHEALATQFENLAKEMQAKIEEQKDIVNHKPRTSYLGRNGHKIKKHIAFKIHKYEKAAAEYLEQAAHHHAMAGEQAENHAVANQNLPNSGSSL
ncbi:MAG: hypothetical protein DHS20C07_31390 [Methyloligella sp.]|nr:MAG: hypothetical protein DHS20C07_31390 [Methyloligella sp.]